MPATSHAPICPANPFWQNLPNSSSLCPIMPPRPPLLGAASSREVLRQPPHDQTHRVIRWHEMHISPALLRRGNNGQKDRDKLAGPTPTVCEPYARLPNHIPHHAPSPTCCPLHQMRDKGAEIQTTNHDIFY